MMWCTSPYIDNQLLMLASHLALILMYYICYKQSVRQYFAFVYGISGQCLELSCAFGIDSFFFLGKQDTDDHYSWFASLKHLLISFDYENHISRDKVWSQTTQTPSSLSPPADFLCLRQRSSMLCIFSLCASVPAFRSWAPEPVRAEVHGSRMILVRSQVAPASAPPPSFVSPSLSPSHISGVSSAPHWPPCMPLNSGA